MPMVRHFSLKGVGRMFRTWNSLVSTGTTNGNVSEMS